MQQGLNSLEQNIQQLKATRDGYLLDLVRDAGSGTQPDYSLEGQSVSRNAWREHLHRQIQNINMTLAQFELFEFTSIQM